MKYLLIAALLVSMGTYAEEAAQIEEPSDTQLEESDNCHNLGKYWFASADSDPT